MASRLRSHRHSPSCLRKPVWMLFTCRRSATAIPSCGALRPMSRLPHRSRGKHKAKGARSRHCHWQDWRPAGRKSLTGGRADFIAMGRSLLADSDIVTKLMARHPENILPCIGCIECREEVLAEHKIVCAVNPSLGREKEFALVPTSQQKRVMIVGGGPAGMTAARVAALRGHQVTLYEKALRLGDNYWQLKNPLTRAPFPA